MTNILFPLLFNSSGLMLCLSLDYHKEIFVIPGENENYKRFFWWELNNRLNLLDLCPEISEYGIKRTFKKSVMGELWN